MHFPWNWHKITLRWLKRNAGYSIKITIVNIFWPIRFHCFDEYEWHTIRGRKNTDFSIYLPKYIHEYKFIQYPQLKAKQDGKIEYVFTSVIQKLFEKFQRFQNIVYIIKKHLYSCDQHTHKPHLLAPLCFHRSHDLLSNFWQFTKKRSVWIVLQTISSLI